MGGKEVSSCTEPRILVSGPHPQDYTITRSHHVSSKQEPHVALNSTSEHVHNRTSRVHQRTTGPGGGSQEPSR